MIFAGLGRAFRVLRLPLMTLPALATLACSAQAADSCAFYKGKTVELVVPFSAGGGYDIYGRMVAKYMGDELGAAHMIVRNQPGAGGLLATNQTWSAPPTGLRIELMPTSGMITAELGGADGVQFKSGGFSWIGRLTGEPDIVGTYPGSPLKTVDDLKRLSAERTVKIGSVGLGDMDYVEGELMGLVLGLNYNVVTGFASVPEVYSALSRGELDMSTASISAFQLAQKADAARPLWIIGNEAVAALPEAKPLGEVVDPKYRPLVKVFADVIAAGRGLAGPPGLPADRLQCLRDAFDRTVRSEGFLTDAQKLNRPVTPLGGVATAQLVDGVTNDAPKEYVDLLRKSYAK